MANFYRVKDGNWDLAESWATTTGGTTYHADPPTSSDDVFFDANTPTGTHTVNVTTNTNNLNFTGFTGTFAGANNSNVYGSLTLGSGMTNTYSGSFEFLGTTAASLTSNGLSISRVEINNASKVLTLQDKLTLTRSSTTWGGLTLTAGTFTHNNQDVEFAGATGFISGAVTLYNLIKNGTTTVVDRMLFDNNITVAGTLTLKGNAVHQRMLVNSNNLGSQRTITAAAIDFANLDFQDIKGAGAASWDLSAITGLSGDCGGNTDITFTTGITCYYVGGAAAGNWSTAAKWMTASGGSTAARVPLPQDSAVIDANSFTSAAILTQNMSRIPGVDFTGSADVTWGTSTIASVFGSLNLTDLAVLNANTQSYTFEGRGAYTLTSAGKTWTKGLELTAPGGTLTLSDDLTNSSGGELVVNNGTFNANNYNVAIKEFSSSNSNVRSVLMGSGTWTLLTGAQTVWNTTLRSNLTFDAGTSTIKLTGVLTSDRIFNVGLSGLVFNNFWNATTGAFAITIHGSNTFNDFKIDAGRIQQFDAGDTQTINTLTALGTSESPITLKSDATSVTTLTKAGGGFIEGVDYLDVSYITGNPDATWYVGANSVDSGNNTRIYFTNAPQTANSERGLYIQGQLTGDSDRGLYLEAVYRGDSERGLYVSGFGVSDSERDLYLQGKLTSDSERGLYLEGYAVVDERGLYLEGFATDSSERGIYVEGNLKGDSERGLYTSGIMDGSALYKNLQITNDNSAVRNRIYVRGGTYLSDTFTMSLVADGETTVFYLPEKPHDITVTEGVTSKTVGTKFIHEFTGYDYLLNYQEKYVETETAPVASTVITFTFKYNIPVLVAVEDTDSIEDHGQAEFAIFDKNINTITQARDRATAELTDYAETVVGGRFQTELNGFKAGQYMQITKTSLGIDEEFLIQRVVAKSIGGGNFVYTVYVTSATVLGIIQFLVDLLERDKNTLNITSDEVVDEITTITGESFTITDGTPVLTTGTGTFEYGDAEYDLASFKPS